MTGPEHYRVSERLLDLAENHTDTRDPRDEELASIFTARAQAHATLALAAAQAATLTDRYVGDGDHVNAWQVAIS